MIVLPFLTYEEIGKEAEAFLAQYHSSYELPVPIEEIVEFDLGLNIVPFPNLYKNHSINGFLTCDMSAIYVDETQFDIYTEKYRFTLAHEVGHLILHKQCYEEVEWSSVEEYVEFRMSIDPYDIDWFETHSNWFAEQVLLPKKQLIEVTYEVVSKHRDKLIKITNETEIIIPYLSKEIARPFEVSPKTVECRLSRKDIRGIIDLGTP